MKPPAHLEHLDEAAHARFGGILRLVLADRQAPGNRD